VRGERRGRLGNTRFFRALALSTAPRKSLENVGVRHATHWVNGYFLTVDLCPSRKVGFDEEIFDALEALAPERGPGMPVGVSVSGLWARSHRRAVRLAPRAAEAAAAAHHLDQPYLLAPVRRAAAGRAKLPARAGRGRRPRDPRLEKLLLENGVVPSVFFRFRAWWPRARWSTRFGATS